MRQLLIVSAIALLAALPERSAAETPLEIWGKIYEVFSHPRCANCHVPEDGRPRWSGPSYGPTARFHGMFVHGGESRIGAETIPCATCHGLENAPQPNGPPGAKVWALAPVEMAWWRKSSAELCAQIKDPERNGGRDVEALAQHIEHDALVLWGWDPGPGRAPAPHSAEALAGFIRAWGAAGAPCPAE